MKNIFIITLVLGFNLLTYTSIAQAKLAVKYDIFCLLPQANEDLSQANLKLLESKIVHGFKAIGYTGSGAKSTFVVYPEINVSEEGVSENGVKNIGLYQVNITFVTKDIFQNRIFNSLEYSTPSAGDTKEKAIRKAFTAINSNHTFENFIKDSFIAIDQYYSSNCDSFKDLSSSLEVEGKYLEAIAVLRTIPPSAPCYKANISSIGRIVNSFNNHKCKELMLSAKADFASGDLYNSLVQLKTVNPASDCHKDALDLINKIANKVSEQELREAEKEAKIRQEEYDLKKIEMQNTKELMKALIERYTFTYHYDVLTIN